MRPAQYEPPAIRQVAGVTNEIAAEIVGNIIQAARNIYATPAGGIARISGRTSGRRRR
jgi:hypothetical protein